MKKNVLQVGYVLFNLIFLLGVGMIIVKAQEGQKSVFIPIINNGSAAVHTITGKVVNLSNQPMAGVTVRTDKGQAGITDQAGKYTIGGLAKGNYTLTPSLGSTVFTPASSSVVVPPDVQMLNFTAVTQCAQVIVNGGFEGDSGWEIPSTEYLAGYSSAQAHSGSRSMRTGITDPAQNISSYSSARQMVTVPVGTASATLTFWLKPYSAQLMGNSTLAEPAIGTQVDSVVMTGDVQYVLVLDSNFNIIQYLVWQVSNSQAWTQYQFNLAGFAGKTIWLHFGTYNDGLDGVSSMYVDDVTLDVCPGGGSPTPTVTPGPCTNLVKNPGFEASSDWEIPNTSWPAGYSSEKAHSGSRSMRTGILNAADNRYSYSDFRQRITIPANAPSAQATFWLYTLSGEAKNLAQPEMIMPTGRPFSETTLSGDVQYVLILDHDQNWIDTLVWQRADEGYWHSYQFDLRRYAGWTIYVQFGTYNDGVYGISSMFVDDVSLQDCTGTPTPTPSPTPTSTPAPCQELITNKNFEANNGWVILDTNYPAAYSNAQYHSAWRSMRTGITDPSQNTYSYSDFRQQVTIPAGSHHVTLSTWLYPVSSESALGTLALPERSEYFGLEPLSSDTQYVLVLDQNQVWIDTLVWMRSNSQVWTNMQFDLSAYAGRTIILQWGSYNDGSNGITSMFVDDTSLQACP